MVAYGEEGRDSDLERSEGPLGRNDVLYVDQVIVKECVLWDN